LFRSPPIIETQYFPVIPFFALGIHFGSLFLEANEHYQKGGFRNKTSILTANGIHHLSVPLEKGKHQQTPIKEVKIDWSENWSRVHWSSIRTAYGNAPYFLHYEDLVHEVFHRPPPYLYDFNQKIIRLIINTLGLSINIIETEEFIFPEEAQRDFRNLFKSQQKQSISWTPLPYSQVFQERYGFIENAGILDLLFCLGPESITYLVQLIEHNKIIMEAS
jgi:hypothetical protein